MKVKQHIIPNFMIKRWTTNNTFDALNKTNLMVKTYSINNNDENPFVLEYAYEDDINSPNTVENILAEIECAFASFTSVLLKSVYKSDNEYYNLSHKQITLIYIWRLIQELRSDWWRRKRAELINKNIATTEEIKTILVNYNLFIINIYKCLYQKIYLKGELPEILKYEENMNNRQEKIIEYISTIKKLWKECKFKAARTMFIKYNIELQNLLFKNSEEEIFNGLLFFIKNFKIFIFKTKKDISLLTDTNYCKTSWNMGMFYIWNMYLSPQVMLCFVHNHLLENLEYWKQKLEIPYANIYDSITLKNKIDYFDFFKGKKNFIVKVSKINEELQNWINEHFVLNSYSDDFILFISDKEFVGWTKSIVKNQVKEFCPHLLMYGDKAIIVSNNKIVTDLNKKKLYIDNEIKNLIGDY